MEKSKIKLMEAVVVSLPLRLLNIVQCYIKQKRYECLLVSFLLLIFGNTFGTSKPFFGVLDIYQNFIAGFIIFYYKKQMRVLILCIIIATIGLDIFKAQLAFIDLRSWHGILYLVFFFLVSKEVFKEVLYAKTISRELLAAAMCGFVLLCLIGTFLFYQVSIESAHAFNISGSERVMLTNLNYFSFTTLLTIGYGDIIPVSLMAKRAVMFVGLAGHFYTVFITSIIIGKYLSVKN